MHWQLPEPLLLASLLSMSSFLSMVTLHVRNVRKRMGTCTNAVCVCLIQVKHTHTPTPLQASSERVLDYRKGIGRTPPLSSHSVLLSSWLPMNLPDRAFTGGTNPLPRGAIHGCTVQLREMESVANVIYEKEKPADQLKSPSSLTRGERSRGGHSRCRCIQFLALKRCLVKKIKN